MNIIELATDQIKLAGKNVRLHNSIQIKEFARSLEMFGQIRPIVIDENMEILCGNGMFMAAQKLGWTSIKALKFDNLTENQKKKLMIADNRIFELGFSNMDVLDEFLNELKGDLDIPGYDEETLNLIVSDVETINENISNYGILNTDMIEEIKDNDEKIQNKIEVAKQQQSIAVTPTDNDMKNNIINQPLQSTQSQDRGRFVVCPKCGEKIWL